MKVKHIFLCSLIQRSLSANVSCAFLLLTSLCVNVKAVGQWQQLLPATSPKQVGTPQEIRDVVYFLDEFGHPEIGFASYNESGTFRTSDGGNTWKKIMNGNVVDMTFKDALHGWTASGLETTDGGTTWSTLLLPASDAKGIHYVSSTDRLFLSFWVSPNSQAPTSYVSTDEGKTWTSFTQDARLNGYAFVDDLHGIAGTTEDKFLPTDGILRTSDGGLTWTYDPTPVGCWQPFAQKLTSTFYYVSEYDNTFRRSDDYGATWSIIGQLPADQTGCLREDLCGNLYAQGSTYLGSTQWMSISHDNGKTWTSIAGPSTCTDTRFYSVGSKVFAQDVDGSLWVYNGPAGTPSLRLPNSITISSFDCDTQVISVPIQSFGCRDGVDSLLADSLLSSGSFSFRQNGSIPRGYEGQDSLHIVYHATQSGRDTATLLLSLRIGGVRFDSSVRIIANAVESRSVTLLDSFFTLSAVNCQMADTMIPILLSGCMGDVDSITRIFISGSDAFSLDSLHSRIIHSKDSVHISYRPSRSGNDTALVNIRFNLQGETIDRSVALYGVSQSQKTVLVPTLAGLGNTSTVRVGPGADVPLALTLSSNVSSLIGLDSLVFEISFDSDMMRFDSVVLSSGWKIKMMELRQGRWVYTLTNDTANIPSTMTLALLHFTSFLAKDSVSIASLDFFNGFLDSNKYAGCGALSIAEGNTVTIRANDTCGDILFRNLMISGSPGFRVISIQPNPANNYLTVDCESPSLTMIESIIYTDLGTKRLEAQQQIQARSTIGLSLAELRPGPYYLVLKSPFGSITAKFVKF